MSNPTTPDTAVLPSPEPRDPVQDLLDRCLGSVTTTEGALDASRVVAELERYVRSMPEAARAGGGGVAERLPYAALCVVALRLADELAVVQDALEVLYRDGRA